MTIKRHEAMILSLRRRSDARQKFSPCDFSFANSCRQIHIFCPKFIISWHFATMAIGSANPVHSRATNSVVGDGILSKFKLIQAFMVVLVTCKNEEDRSKKEGTQVVTTFSNYKSLGIFSNAQGQLTPQPLVKSCQISNLFEIFYSCPCYLQE